ncbi:WAT1-related protein At3g18200 [Linum perenne]
MASERVKLVLGLLVLQLCFSGFHIVSRVALNIGVSQVVYPVYRNTIALFLLAPFAYFLEKKERPPLTLSLLVQFFLLALVGITANQGFYLLGLYYASPTFASAMQNSVPAITFLMASVLGVEQVNLRRRDGLAKVLGTIACIGGATIITLYKGPPLLHNNQEQQPLMESDESKKLQNWTWGCIYLLGHCLSWAGWMVFQAPVLKKYPAKLTMTSFTCFFGLIQFLFIASFLETDLNNWKIHSLEELFTILYAVSMIICVPLSTILVAIMAALILGDQLYSGGMIGAVLIMFGLYCVLWGKNEEKNDRTDQKDDSLTRNLLQHADEHDQIDRDTDLP